MPRNGHLSHKLHIDECEKVLSRVAAVNHPKVVLKLLKCVHEFEF